MVQTTTPTDPSPSAPKRTNKPKVFLRSLVAKWRVSFDWVRRLKSARRQSDQEDQYLLQAAASATSVSAASTITQAPDDSVSKCSISVVEADVADTIQSPAEVTPWCCKLPQLVEMPLFLYFLAYKACLPLKVRNQLYYLCTIDR